MSKIVRKGKQNRHEKITQVMLSGKPVTPEEIAMTFKGTDQEAVLYRLSTNIYNIRLDGGIVKVIKNGRKVQAYQLVNHEEFDLKGRYVGKVLKPNQVKTEVKTEVTAEVKVPSINDELMALADEVNSEVTV
jgi:hypothetical protein